MSQRQGGKSKTATQTLVDEVTIEVQAGDGGNGAATFRREKYQPAGGPNGGAGGRGGDVILVARPELKTLTDLQHHPHWKARRGGHGAASNKTGANGASRIIPVPVGTAVYDAETDELLADLTTPGDTCVVARGGRGGRGNARLASRRLRSPRFAEKGEPGQHRRLRLVLKLLAEVGIIGFPNAGKSTLLARISAAKPKIASYPFTTLAPNLGVVFLDNITSFVVADIPGIIEGAHAGRGLGHQFLRHVERTRVLIHLLNLAAPEGRNPVNDFHALNQELRLFSEQLADKPQIVVGNKIDLPEARACIEKIRPEFCACGKSLLAISAATGEGIPILLQEVVRLLQATSSPEQHQPRAPRMFTVPPPSRKPIRIEVSREYGYIVSGDAVERLVAMTDVENPEALAYMHRKLERMGVIRRLKEAGIQDGDYVRIGNFVSNFVDEDATA